ncbi:MAG: hypothetical protein JWR04_1455 [Rhodoglobus sp.]|nr:hypothetical protein [Rhodoglobus sp.]
MTPCPNCGFVSRPGAMFCGSCAFRLDGPAPAGAAEPVAPDAAAAVPAAPPALVPPPPAPAPPLLPIAGETSGWGAPAADVPVEVAPAPPVGIAPPPGGISAPPPTNTFLFTGLPIAAEVPSPQVVAPPPQVIAPPAPAASPIAPPPVVSTPIAPLPVPDPEQIPPAPEFVPDPVPPAPEPPAPEPAPAPAPEPPTAAQAASAASLPSLVLEEDEEDDENDATVVSDRRSSTGWRIVLDGGTQQGVGGQVLVGRQVKSADPRWPGARLLSVADTTKSVSKVHALFEADANNFWATDLGSTNGVIIALANGSELVLASGVRGAVPPGSEIVLGNYVIKVEKD